MEAVNLPVSTPKVQKRLGTPPKLTVPSGKAQPCQDRQKGPRTTASACKIPPPGHPPVHPGGGGGVGVGRAKGSLPWQLRGKTASGCRDLSSSRSARCPCATRGGGRRSGGEPRRSSGETTRFCQWRWAPPGAPHVRGREPGESKGKANKS